MNRELARKDLIDIKKALDSKGIKFFLAYGVVLGAIREKDFIEHDDDIDLIITQKLTYKEKKDIGWLLHDIGFQTNSDILWNVYGRFEENQFGYNGTDETGIIAVRRGIPVSVMFFYDNGKEWMCIPRRGGIPVLTVPYKFLEKGKTIKFKGEKFLIPSPTIEYLEYTYGKDWKTPIEDKHAKQYWQGKNIKELAKKYFAK